MSSIASKIRRRLPMRILEKFYVAYWRQHKDNKIKSLHAEGIHNLNIEADAYARRHEIHSYVQKEFIGDQPIIYLEFGVFQGESILHWAKVNTHTDSRFFGFDTFEGLPEDWKDYNAGHFSTQGHVPQTDDPRVTFIRGLFQETLDRTLAEIPTDRPWVIHIDSDLYSAALYILTRLHDRLVPGTLILFDQWVDAHEYRALHDYCQAYGTQPRLIATLNSDFSKVAFRVET